LAAIGASPNATPARSWTTPSCRSAAIRRRSFSEASIARASSRSRSVWPRCSERELDQQEDSHRGQQRRRERAQEPRRARADRAEALVGLEQHRRAVGRADRRVRLQQLALLALVAVLGLAEVAQLRVGAAGLEQLRLFGSQREALPDQPRLVGVEDRPVRAPQLHAHDRLAEDLALDEIVELPQRPRVSLQYTVGQRRLDEPALDLDALARVALGLLDRHRAQREVATDHDDRDRDEAARREADDRGDDLWRGFNGRGVPRVR
jgi:hypothetical protein